MSVVVSEKSGRGKIFAYVIDGLRRFRLRHESVTCVDLGREWYVASSSPSRTDND